MSEDETTKTMQTSSSTEFRVVIIGLARNCAHSLPRLLNDFSSFGSELSDWGYIFLENGSHDGSLNILRSFDERHEKGVVKTFPNLENEVPKRTERLSFLRNHALKELREDERLCEFEFAIIVDLDGVNEIFPQQRILSHMNNWPDDQAAVFANQTDLYYDAWAYRHPKYSPDDGWKSVRNRPSGTSKNDAIETVFRSRQIPWPKDVGKVEVESAFGGLGIYKISSVKGCEYLGVDEDGFQICEHVEFHRQIRKKGYRLFIDAGMINGSGAAEHRPARLARSFMRLKNTICKLAGHQ